MTPQELSEIHKMCFDYAPRPWNAEEIDSLLATSGAVLLEKNGGFAIFRTAGPEAELLTIAVDPASRRKGVAQSLLQQAHIELGVKQVFLEVAKTNYPAINLYKKCGYNIKAERPNYYKREDGSKISALVMAVDL